MKISFTVFGHCEPQGSTRAFVPKGWKRPIVTSDNPKLKPWRQQITRTAIEELSGEIAPKEQAVTLKLDFYVARPASKPKRITQPITRPDLDKYIRAVKDGLKGAAYEDDSQVCTIIAAKHYGTPERVEITVATAEEAAQVLHEAKSRTMPAELERLRAASIFRTLDDRWPNLAMEGWDEEEAIALILGALRAEAAPVREPTCVTFEDSVTQRDGTLTLQDRIFSMLPANRLQRGDKVRVTVENLTTARAPAEAARASSSILRDKEILDAKHIRAATRDGCTCDLCEAARASGVGR